MKNHQVLLKRLAGSDSRRALVDIAKKAVEMVKEINDDNIYNNTCNRADLSGVCAAFRAALPPYEAVDLPASDLDLYELIMKPLYSFMGGPEQKIGVIAVSEVAKEVLGGK